METSLYDAVSIMRKWQQEKRVVQCSIYDLPADAEKASFTIFGRIEHLDETNLRIDARTIFERLGQYIACTIVLSGARFHFGGYRDAPPETAQQFERSFDSFLQIIPESGSVCEIMAAKPSAELMDQFGR
jgi:hypothetical protein